MRTLLLALLLAGAAHAAEPLGGLAVACSPDGKTLALAGDNRTLYVVDASTLKVTRRVWLGTPAVALTYNKDGSRLLVEDTRATLWLVDTKAWTHARVAERAAHISPARAVNLCAAYDEYHRAPAGAPQPAVVLLSLADGAVVGTLPLGKGERAAGMALSPDGTRVAVLSHARTDAAERRVARIPAHLEGLARSVFQQSNDGRTARFRVLEVAGGKPLSDGSTFFSARRATLVFDRNDVRAITPDGIHARISRDLTTTLFRLGDTHHRTVALSDDHRVLLAGGLRSGARVSVGDTLDRTTFRIPRLPGGPEYVTGAAFASNGTAYATTSAYRLIRIRPDGTRDAITPIH